MNTKVVSTVTGKPVRCMRCHKRCRTAVWIAGLVIGHLCPDCQLLLDVAEPEVLGMDWQIQLGQALRDELGWDDYPASPDLPE